MTVFCANTNILELIGLKSATDNTYINDATVAVTIYDHARAWVGNETWPLTLSYVVGSNGVYRAILSDALPLQPDKDYTAYIEASAGAGRVGHWEHVFRPTARRSI